MRRLVSFREHHDTWVGGWISKSASGLRPTERVARFDEAFAAIWHRAHLTLGDLTLATIVGRTLKDACQMFPQLTGLKLETAGVSFRELREGGTAKTDPEITEALRYFLVELLTAIGMLTSEALTPVLRGAVVSSDRAPGRGAMSEGRR